MEEDVVIIGGGPAGLSAGIFACRAGLNVVLIESMVLGGKVSVTHTVANYPGFEDINGFDLMEKMSNQAEKLGLKIEYGTVKELTKTKTKFNIKTADKNITAKKVIIACGCKVRKLGLENEEKLTGKGISYCASCDGRFFKDKTVAVVGGGNSAIEYVDYLSRIAKKIYLINRRDVFRAGEHELNRIKKYKNLEIIACAQVKQLLADDVLKQIVVEVNNKQQKIAVDGLFVAIGQIPDLKFVNLDVKLDQFGYILVDKNMQTNIKNLYACGDIISKGFRQIITACSDGAIAGNACIGDK